MFLVEFFSAEVIILSREEVLLFVLTQRQGQQHYATNNRNRRYVKYGRKKLVLY